MTDSTSDPHSDTGSLDEPPHREKLLAEIRRLADGNDPPTVMEAYHYGIYSIEKYHDRFDSWPAAVEQAMSKDMTVRTRGHYEIPNEDLLAEIRRLANGDDPPTAAEMGDEGQYSVDAYQDRFGSWNAAIKEAMGEDVELVGRRRKEIPDEELLAEIRRLADGDDPPTAGQMDAEGEYSATTYRDRFESWNEAIREAMGEDVTLRTHGGEKISDEELLAEIRRLADGDDPPTVTEMDDEGAYSVQTYQRRFGSWNAAVAEAMGDDAAVRTWRTNVPDEELLAEIRRLADGDDPPTASEMADEGAYSTGLYYDRFGSWNAAVKETMGDDVTLPTRGRDEIPKEDLLAEIRRLTDGDDPPTAAEMDDEGAYSVQTYYRRFGSWNDAVEQAMGEDVTVRTRDSEIPKEDLLAEIRRFADGDNPPTTEEMEEDGEYSTTPYYNRFGSWNEAVREALDNS